MDFSRQNIESAFSTLYNGNDKEITDANAFLMEWTQTPECPLTAFEIFAESNNFQHQSMALSILYRQIQNCWSHFDDIFRNSVKEFFFKLLLEGFPSPTIERTFISIIVLIAIYEWPEVFPDYFELIFDLENYTYLFHIISEFLSLLGDCNFIIRSRLVSLQSAFVEHNYVKIVISLIQQTVGQLQQENQDQYKDDILSIFNSLFTWCDIQSFLTEDILEYIISQLPNQLAYDCLTSLFINRADTSEILVSILPNLLQNIIGNPNPNFLFIFLRKFGRIIEKTESESLTQLYLILLEIDIDIEDLDDFWELWYVVVHRILFASNSQEEDDILLVKIYSPLFDSMRNKFVNLLPLAISNGKIVDYTAISTWELLNRIDKEGFLTFFAELQQQLEAKSDEKNQILVDINYCASSLNFLIKTTQDQELLSLLSEYFTNLLLEDFSMIDIESTIFALSRSTLLLVNDMGIFEKFIEFIVNCFKSDDLDYKETAANCFYFTLKEIPDFFALTATEFSLAFLNSINDLLNESIEGEIQDDTYLIMLFRCATLLSTILTKRSIEEGEIDLTFYDLISDPVIEIIDDSAPIALKIISEIAKTSSDLCFYSFRKFWSPLFALAKTNDSLINEMIVDAFCSGISNCDYEKVQQQIKIFVDLLLNVIMEPELAVYAISKCRESDSRFDEYFPYFENLLDSPSTSLFMMYSTFSPHLVKFEKAIPLICEGIVNVDINVCVSALNCIKKFLNLINEEDEEVDAVVDFGQSLIANFGLMIIHAVIQALIDFSHCSLVSKLSSVLIKIIVVCKALNIENFEIDFFNTLSSLCPDDQDENELENFVKSFILACDDKAKANQIVADFLIMMKSANLPEKVEILNGIEEIDDEEKRVIDEVEKLLDINVK